MTDWDDDILGDDDSEDGVIELTDVVDEESDPSAADVIELTDIVEPESADLNLDIVTEESFDVQHETEPEADDGFDNGLELEMETLQEVESVEVDADVPPAGELSVTQEQVEAALERVIEKKFADKIDVILFEVMEKVIEKEIVEIKKSLQQDLDQIGNV